MGGERCNISGGGGGGGTNAAIFLVVVLTLQYFWETFLTEHIITFFEPVYSSTFTEK